MNKLWLFVSILQSSIASPDGSRLSKVMSFIAQRSSTVSHVVLLVLLLSGATVVSQSQGLPVQVIPQVIPPTPILISDFANANTVNTPLRVQLILNDFTLTNREVRLKVFFEGNGIAFQSNTIVAGAPSLFLEGGIPTVLSNVELAPYFRFENITGISPNVYGQTIPEGAYQFCFEVFDVLTGRRLSNRSCVTTVIFKNEPPFLVAPLNKSNIEQQNPQNIVFQWTPRHINVGNVEYELSIVEIWDNTVDPQTAFLSSPPVFQTTTSATTYVYGPADPLFLSNKKYAWRVQAMAKQGTEEIGLFKNNGFSEIFSFSYATPCDAPISITHEIKGAHQVNINWEDFTTEIPKFNVRYRKQGDSGEWFYSSTSANWITLWDLRAETSYEFQVNKRCSVSESDWTFLDTFTTGSEQDEAAVYNCGIPPDINLDNKEPLPGIEVGETFLAGDFKVKIQEVSGSEGRFTGKGYVAIPYLKSIKVAVKFTNILINTDKQLAEGMVITVYDPSLKNIVDVDEAIDTVTDIVEAVGEIFEGDNDLDEININFDIEEDDITIEDGRIVITNPETGDRFDYPLGDDTVITDASGDVYHVDEQGNVTKGGQKDPGGIVSSSNVDGVSGNGELESLTAQGIVVYFEDAKSTFGFDKVPDSQKDKLTEHYVTVKDAAGKDYTLVHQAVQKGTNTTIIAKVQQDSTAYNPSDIIFKTKQGEKLLTKVQADSTTIEITVKGHYTFENETIYAVVPSKTEENKQLTAGAFTLWHLTERKVDIVLVPVNNASLRNNEVTQVADIFKKGAATLNIRLGETFTFDKNSLGVNGLDVGESPWLTSYNEEQKSIMAAFKKDPNSNYNKNTYYVFVFNDITPSRNIAGFMPLQRQYGFVFDSSITAPLEGKGDLTKTIAHEIGHGVFALQHPFKSLKTDESQTQWLMDYSNGDLLSHMNWAQIHNPELKFYIFQDEEDGEISVTSKELIERLFNDIYCAKFKSEPTAKIYTKHKLTRNKNLQGDRNKKVWGVRILEVTFFHVITDLINIELDFEERVLDANDGRNYKMIRFYDKGNKEFYIDIVPHQDDYSILVENLKNTESQFIVDEHNNQINYYNQIKNNGEEEIKQYLYSLSPCVLDNLPVEARISIIESISQEWVVDSDVEELVIRLLEATYTKEDVSYFVKNTQKADMWNELFNDIDSSENAALFAGQLVRIAKVYYENNPIEDKIVGAADVKTHKVKLLSDYQFIEGTSNVTILEKERNYYCAGIGAGWLYECGMEETILFENKSIWDLVTVKFEESNSYANIEADQKIKLIPIGLLVYFTEEQMTGALKQRFFTTLDIALFAVGIGEINAAVKGIRAAGYTFSSLLRLSLGIADLSAMGMDVACNTANQDELCNEWKEISLYVNLGLISVSGLNQLSDIITKTKQFDDTGEFTRLLEDINNAGGALLSSFKSKLSSRISSTSGFILKHTDDEIKAIIQKGKSLNLPDDVIDDLLFVSCREAKLIDADELVKQMDNWVNVVQKRGFPYKFTGRAQFNSFKTSLKTRLNSLGISTSDVRIQGSSLRSSKALDVDLVAMVSQKDFDNFIKTRFNGKIKKNGIDVDISNMSTQELKKLSDDVVSNRSLYNRTAFEDFSYTVNSQIINAKGSKNIINGLKKEKNSLANYYSNLNIENIAIQTSSSKFNLNPFIKL